MKRSNLIAARIGAGFNSQQDFIDFLKNKGFVLSIHEYGNIENGRKKEVGLNDAMVIASSLGKIKELDTLFLQVPTYKIRKNSLSKDTKRPDPAA